MKAARGHRDDDISRLNAVGAQHLVSLDRTDGRAGDVVIMFAQESRVLGSLATNQGGTGERARLGDSTDDVGDAFRNDLAARDVVRHEQGLCANDHDVVHDHPHQIVPDGVMNVERLGDGDLGADTVGRGRENRAAEILEERHVHEPSETADAA